MIRDQVLDALPEVTSELVITPVPQEFLADEFIMNGPMIARAARTSEGRYESSDLFDACWENRMLMWIAVRMYSNNRRKTLGVVFTEITDYPRLRALRIRYAAGVEIGEWVSRLYTTMQEAMKQENCDMIETVCRPGWARLLRKHNIKPKAIILELRA